MAKGDLPRQTVVHPVGLVTQPNEFGYYVDGALEHAINCVMRNPGELDGAPSMFASLSVGPVSNTLRALLPLDAGHVYELTVSAGGVWTVTELGNTASFPAGAATFDSTNAFSNTGRISLARAKDRALFNSSQGCLVGDFMAPTSAAQRALRIASLTQPQIVSLGTTTTNAGAIPTDLSVTYAAIVTRTFSDGYILASVPSPLIRLVNNTGSTVNATLAVRFGSFGSQFKVGDVVELYRSDGIFNATNVQAEPSTVLKLVQAVTLVAADITNGFVALTDAQVLGGAPYYQTTGRELYCNPGQGGSTTINRQPPISQCIGTFDGRTFYGNTTDRPKMSFSIPGGVGSSANPLQQTDYFRTYGIGNRFGLGTVTSGSAVITGVGATQFAGLKVGQRWSGNAAAWSQATAFIQSINSGAGTITLNAVAAANDTVWNFADCIEISLPAGGTGTAIYRFKDYSDLINALAGNAVNPPTVGPQFEVTTSQSFPGTTISTLYTTGATITIEPISHVLGATMSIRATNGANYTPALAELYTTFPTQPTATVFSRTQLKNHMVCSKDQQPEHVPPGGVGVNEFFVGLRELIALVSTEAALWIACLDGIFRLSGVNGQYRIDPIDSTKIICGPQCMTSMDEDVYIYTNYGMLQIDSQTRDNLTDTIIGDLLPGPEYAEVATRVLCSHETELEIVYLDSSSANKLWIYATREGGGWTTLENNGAALSNVTALAYQRSPASGDPRLLVGVSPLAGVAASYAGWGNTAAYLVMDFQFQPFYADDPMSLKQFIEASFLWNAVNTGKSLRPMWNSTPIGSANIVQYQNAAYARAGVPRVHATSQSISVGCDSVTGTGTQPRFLGVSLVYLPLTTQAKQRGT